MSKRLRKKRLTRAMPAYPVQYAPGGATMYVPPGYQQSLLGQTYYGSTLKNAPSQWTSLFSPGVPLPPQPTVNPNGLPIQFKFPVAYNTFPVDRTLGNADIPSFEQLKRLAQMDYGTAICERYWLDMVPRMKVKVALTPEAIAGGAEEQHYQEELTYFKHWFDRPDAMNALDIHSWMRSALINQSRYDELYLYKNRTRGGKLLGLEVIDGSQMKPLLDDWGRLPPPPKYAYQQYPWGIPGYQYTQDQMIHYRESPASDTPYGQSRIERIILITNLALRKQKQDLSHFTEGNIPAGILTPPEGSNWTPDQLDAYEQSWNALLAGNLAQMVRIKVTQPGFSYTPFVQPNFDSVFDRFLLNIRAASYGLTMSDLGFTESVNKSSGDTQENVTYRRTIGPIAAIYAMILTDIMQHDFEPSLHGDLFCLSFGGYEEAEDLSAQASAYSTLTGAGILGLSNASKLLKLPEDPDAPHIGRVLITKDGPVFLDDLASDEVRHAALAAKLAGFELAVNPPQPDVSQKGANDEDDTGPPAPQGRDTQQGQAQNPAKDSQESAQERVRAAPAQAVPARVSQQGTCGCATCIERHGKPVQTLPPYHEGCDCTAAPPREGDDPHVTRTQQNAEGPTSSHGHPGRGDRAAATGAPTTGDSQLETAGSTHREASIDYRRWRERALDDAKKQKAQRGFTSAFIPAPVHSFLTQLLSRCNTPDDVRAVFTRAQAQESELIGGQPRLEYNATLGIWEAADTEEQLEAMRAQGTQFLRWMTGVSLSGVCPVCGVNDGEVVAVGQPFKSGHRLPQCHIGCQCGVTQMTERPGT